MRRCLSDLPLKHKLTLISLLTSIIALTLCCVGFVVNERIAFKKDLVADTSSVAGIIAHSSASALFFNDTESAEDTLQALSAQPHIVAACIYDHEGQLFAAYPKNKADFGPRVSGSTERFQADHLDLFRPITAFGDEVGSLYLRTDLLEMREILLRNVFILGGVMALAILVAYVIASRLQRMISAPVSDLVAVAGRVATEKNYAVRVTKRGNDEFGSLIDSFNDMLSQIQARDIALQAANDRLEQRVEERTSKLAEASGLLEAMLDNSPDFIYFKDLDSRFVRFSRACLPRLGLTEPEMLRGKTDADFFAPSHAEPALADEQEVIRTGQAIVSHQEKETYPDGRVAWVLTTKMPWRDGSGAIVGTFGISRDVTELKEAESKLAYERDQLRALLDSSPDTIYFKDEQSRFALVSRSMVQIALTHAPGLRYRRSVAGLPVDVSEENLLDGLTDFDVYREEEARLAQEEEQDIVRTGKAIVGKLEKQTFLDENIRWSLTSKMPWRDHNKKIIGTFGISKNITDLKETEEKIGLLHRQLLETSRQAGMAEVATGVLHNVGNVLNSVNVSATLVADHVRHTQAANVSKLATLVSQHKDDLADFLTKDSRGQMIPAYLGTLAEMLTEEQKTVISELDNLRKNIEHIKEIVAMQQSYARTSGVIETVSVTDMIEDALRINAGSLARHDVDTFRDYQARPVVTTDKHKVIQILINLVRNAKYACDESGRTDKKITVRTSSDERGVKIAVTDNGVGIPPENLTRIFNHGFTTRKTGHGFGLHSGALAAKELGGSIDVRSEGLGLGATFILELPYKPDLPDHANSVR